MRHTSDDIQQAAALIRNARFVVALSGAGLSAGSGIPTYRGAGGLWTQHGTPPLLSYQEFAWDPAAWWRARLEAEKDPSHPVYQMKQAVDRALPNAGHLALAELELARRTAVRHHPERGQPARRGGQPRSAGDSRQPEPAPMSAVQSAHSPGIISTLPRCHPPAENAEGCSNWTQ